MGLEKQQGSFPARHTPWQHIRFKDMPAPRHAASSYSPGPLSCAASTLRLTWLPQEVLPSVSPSDGQVHRGPVKDLNQKPPQLPDFLSPLLRPFSSPPATPASRASPEQHPTTARAAAKHRLLRELSSLLAARGEGRSCSALSPLPTGPPKSREMTTQQLPPLSGGWGGRHKHFGERRIDLNKSQTKRS